MAATRRSAPPDVPLETLIAAARGRPGMYAPTGYVLLDEALAHAMRAHEAGIVGALVVELTAEGMITLEDDGPSIAWSEATDGPTIDGALGGLRVFRDHETHLTRVEGGTISLGLSLVRALATTMLVESRCGGWSVTARFDGGELVDQQRRPCAMDERGTRIAFVIEHARLDPVRVATRLADLAAIYPELTISFTSPLTRGLPRRLRASVDLNDSLHSEPFERSWTDGSAACDVALPLLRRPVGALRLFANGRPFTLGSVRTAITRVIFRELPPRKGARPRRCAHVAMIMSIRAPEVRLGDATSSTLVSPDLRRSTARELRALFEEIARVSPDVLEACRRAAKA